MKKLFITPIILAGLLSVAAPAAAFCADQTSTSSISRSCESGVAVYRGQQNGPDFRFVKLAQERDIAQARAREAQARASVAQRQQEQAAARLNRNTGAAPRISRRTFTIGGLGFGFSNGFFPGGFGGFGGNINPRGFTGGSFSRGGFSGGSFGRTGGISSINRVSIAGGVSRPSFGGPSGIRVPLSGGIARIGSGSFGGGRR